MDKPEVGCAFVGVVVYFAALIGLLAAVPDAWQVPVFGVWFGATVVLVIVAYRKGWV